jgi:hypothetical protein
MISNAVEMRPASLDVLLMHSDFIIVDMVKMLGLGALLPLVLKEPSDCKMAGLPLKDVWRSATTMPGAQCVNTPGMMKMPE